VNLLTQDEMVTSLAAAGVVAPDAAEVARKSAASSGKGAVDVLFEDRLADASALSRAVAGIMGLPFADLETHAAGPDVCALLPRRLVVRYKVFPMAYDGTVLQVATSAPYNIRAFDELRSLASVDIEPVVASPDAIGKAIDRHYGLGADTVDTLVDAGNGVSVLDASNVQADITAASEEATLIRFVNQVLVEALRLRATDVHIEPFENRIVVRYRIDGMLYPAPIPEEAGRFQRAIVSRIKIMSNLNIAETRLPQDGRLKLVVHGREIDVRVSIIPMLFGEGVVLRLLDKSNLFFSLEALGMAGDTLAGFRAVIARPHGIFLVTGPTGSGKTTTLYAALEKIRSPELKLITIEDPIEYQLDGVNQIQVKPEIRFDFAQGLRRILRHDPDVVMVGEIRDRETAETAIQAAMTGHLVFSTLHTNDAAGALTRLVHMGIEPYLVGSSVEGVMAQRLVRILCLSCKAPETSHEAFDLAERSGLGRPEALFKAVGCRDCRGTGYRGRQGIFELLLVDDAVRDMVLEHEPSTSIRKHAVSRGMRTLRGDGWLKAFAGLTTVEEVLRVSKDDLAGANGSREGK
jgi:general secretion pathway protein E/type IV pilus assembly protein PilB